MKAIKKKEMSSESLSSIQVSTCNWTGVFEPYRSLTQDKNAAAAGRGTAATCRPQYFRRYDRVSGSVPPSACLARLFLPRDSSDKQPIDYNKT